MPSNNNIHEEILDDEMEIDLAAFMLKLKSKWKVLVLGFVIGGLVAALYGTYMVKPSYQSTASVYLRGQSSSLSVTDLQIGMQLTNDYEIIFKSRPVLENTIYELGLDMSYGQLASIVSITNPEDSRVLRISATAGSPEEAKNIVNSVMENGIDMVAEIDSNQPYVIEKGIANTTNVSTSPVKLAVLGSLGGTFLMAGLVFVAFVLSDNIKSVEDVERGLGIPVLTMVKEDREHLKKSKR